MNLIQDYQLVESIYTNDQYQLTRVIFSREKTPVIIKKINSKSPKIEVKRTLAHEYRLLKKFTAQTIIKAHRLENYERDCVLVLEDFAGENLWQFWQSSPRKFADFLTIAVQLAIALETIHNQGVIHQNIQPDCMLIDPLSLELKIVDFSLATIKSVSVTKLLPSLNLAYIAPEQTGRMNIPLDYRTDFYSTGIIFYQMLTGSVPYQAQKSWELIHCHLAQIPPAPNDLDEDIPEILSSIVMKLLAKNPEDRYQSASALKADLQRCQGQYNEQQSIELFELGTLDHRSQFKLATKLYGRATALEAIAESLARIGSETGEMLLLMGDSGIGKTVLVNQVISSIIGTRGYFITGKFESFTKDIPYKAITEALRELIQHLLTETPENRQFWQQKIQQTIGSNGKVITNILPELELIIGSQPELPPLQLKEQENLFNTVFVKFLKIFAQPKLPLILFLDNLQWADSSSLSLIELLLNECKGHDLLIVAACRNQNLSPSDPLWQAIENMAQIVRLNQINLSPLTINEINSLLIDSLECDSEQSFPLAQLLWQRSHGNPFFVHLLLQSFNHTELLKFDFATLSWQWSIEELRNTSIANYNILELVCRNLNQLPLACLQILKLAACIGNCFNLDLLTDIWQQATEQPIEFQIDFFTFPNQNAIAQELDYALQEGIIVPQESQGKVDYQFVHDHVHQTVYSFLEPEELVKLHSLIGNFYLEQMSPPEIAEKIFEIVRHLNLGRTSLQEQSEIDHLIELNLAAGQKAKAANAHQLAVYYLDIALDLLPSSYWQDNYSLILAVFLQASEVHYLQGNFIYAEQLINIVLTQAQTVLEWVPVYKTKIHTSIAQNEMQLAIDIGLHMLKLLKIDLPNSFTDVEEDALCLEINIKNIKSLKNLPIMTDRSQIRAIEILTTIIPPVYIVKPELFPVLVAKMIDICLQYGNCYLSAYAYALYGLLLCTSGNIETGYHLGKLALELQEQFDAREIESKVSFLFNNMIRHWREPAILTLDHFLVGIESGLEVGDIEHACFHATRYCAHLFYVGESLSAANQKSAKQIKLISDFQQSFQLNYAQMWHQFNLNLQGKAEDNFLLTGDIFDETKFFDLWLESNNAMSLFSFYLIKLILAYLWGDYQQAVIYGSQGKQYLQAAVGLMGYGVYHFYYALAMLAICSQPDKRAEYLSEILACQTKICHWSNHTADYLHKRELIAAEMAKISGEHESAAEHYDQAIIAASAAGYTHELALAEELAGEFYLSKGKTKIAYYYLNDAYKSYQRWGAWAKVRQLELKQPLLLNSVVEPELTENSDRFESMELDSYKSGSNLADFDLFSIIKASQAISSEIILDNLLFKMMTIVMENAGAQKGILILQQNSSWIIAALAFIDSEIKVDLPYIPLAEYKDLPNSIINYIQSTHKTVMLEEANQDGLFIDDDYIIMNQPQSILCSPIIYQDRLQGIMYLESLVKGAFTNQKSAVLQALMSQVSISIANAQLYKDLEDHASVQKSLHQKEILLKEIHHRVKNNLFVVSSLLDFQNNYVDDPEVRKLLENCQNRITAMAIVHQHLYGNSELDRINFADYIQSLLNNLAYSQGSKERNINLTLDLDPIELNIESANPCGLIVNELVSNALEHGFRDRVSGNIWLKLKHNLDNQIVLTIEDDGVGFKPDKNLQNSDSLGLELVCTLVEQIEGQISLDKSAGTKIEIIFDELDYHSRI